jgi:hypothetical protein
MALIDFHDAMNRFVLARNPPAQLGFEPFGFVAATSRIE